jgi:hypothetical protein
MDQKKAAMVAAVCGAVAVIGVFLPWWSWGGDSVYSEVARAMGAKTSANGLDVGSGTFTLILSLLGGIAAALIWKGKTQGLPLNARQLAFVAVGAFGLGALLTLIDVMRSGYGKSFGIFLTLLATLGAGFCAWVMLQKTPAPTGGSTPPAAPPPAS